MCVQCPADGEDVLWGASRLGYQWMASFAPPRQVNSGAAALAGGGNPM